MKGKIILGILGILIGIFLIASVVAPDTVAIAPDNSYVFQQHEVVDLKIPVFYFNNSKSSSSISCFLTVTEPDGDVIINDAQMTSNPEGYFNYTRNGFSENGVHPSSMRCDNTADFGFSTFTILITPTGRTGLLGFFFLIIGISYFMLIFGTYQGDVTITMLGSMAMFFLGIYVLFFGLDIYKNYLTNGFAILTLGTAMYVSVRMGFEYINS